VKGLHGKVAFAVQRLVECETGARHTYFELTEQFQRSYMTPGLQELSAYYSNRMSYAEVEGLLARLSGERLLSDQRIEQLVIDQAVEVSQRWAQAAEGAQEGAPAAPLKVNPAVDLYAAEVVEVRLLEDGIGVKAQKGWRAHGGDETAAPEGADFPKRVTTDVVMLERRDGRYQYLCEGMDAQGQPLVTLEENVRGALQRDYGGHDGPLNVVSIGDGASTIRKSLQEIFGTTPAVILDWYHLEKKMGDLMSMMAVNKADKERHLQVLRGQLWAGQVDPALEYLHTEVAVRNRDKHEELIGYLDKHRHEIIDYGTRQAVGKPIGSGRMEKGVDQVIGHRQKKKGMAWSAKGSKALAILKVVELNGQWQQLWFPEEQELKTAA
jgi:hypothetical protein